MQLPLLQVKKQLQLFSSANALESAASHKYLLMGKHAEELFYCILFHISAVTTRLYPRGKNVFTDSEEKIIACFLSIDLSQFLLLV